MRFMGLLDGAVNGMIGRLTAVGYTEGEAFFLSQAAYIKEDKRHRAVPPTQLSRKDASWEINQCLRRMGMYPMGVAAHRERIRLWEKIFGFGSWHEPIDRAEVYDSFELVSLRIASGAKVFKAICFGSSEEPYGRQVEEAKENALAVLRKRVAEARYVFDPQQAGLSVHKVGDPDVPTALAKFNVDIRELQQYRVGRPFALAWLVAFRG